MSTPFIHRLIACIPVCPTALFHNDVNSADSVDSHNGDAAAVEETMATQGLEDLDEVENLALSFGLMDPQGYVDMQEPWIEGPRGAKVSSSWNAFAKPR
jgi:hypothetical protein